MVEQAALVPVATAEPLKLDLGCGINKKPGFLGVDSRKFDGVDIVADLTQTWPWKDDSVGEVHCSHFLEHLTGKERIHFFNELYRVMQKGSKAFLIVPSWTSERAYGDPTHQWPPVVGMSFFYLDKKWRAANAPHVGFTCDFEFSGGPVFGPPWTLRNQEVQAFACSHYLNVVQDTVVTVTKRV